MLRYGNTSNGFYCDNDISLSELYPVTVQIRTIAAGESFNLYTQYCYILIILEGGSLRISSKRFNSTLSSDRLIIADAFNPCHMFAVTDCRITVIRFSGSRANDFSPFIGTIYPAHGLFGEVSALMKRKEIHDVFFVSLLFKLYGLLEVYKVQPDSAKPLNRYVKMVKDNIDNSFLSPGYSLEVIAGELGINPSYLSRLFKKELGVSMQEYLKNLRLSMGYELLLQGYKVKDAAEKCGIRHVNNFSQMFFHRYGMRPSEVQTSLVKPSEVNLSEVNPNDGK